MDNKDDEIYNKLRKFLIENPIIKEQFPDMPDEYIKSIEKLISSGIGLAKKQKGDNYTLKDALIGFVYYTEITDPKNPVPIGQLLNVANSKQDIN